MTGTISRFFSALTILILTIVLQLFFASIGWYFTLSLAALIAFTSIFDIWELLVLDLLAIFILNWKPAPSAALIAFALVPLLVFVLRKAINSVPWISNLMALFFGFALFYWIAAPAVFFPHFLSFLKDVTVSLAAGELIFFALK